MDHESILHQEDYSISETHRLTGSLVNAGNTPNMNSDTSKSNTADWQNFSQQTQSKGNTGIQKCSFRIGWKTPLAMISSYVLALFIAAIHLTAFLYLNGSQVNIVFTQSQLTYASNFLASAFGASIRFSLAIIFTQLFWSVVRKNYLRLDIIECLYTLHNNIFLIFSWNAWKQKVWKQSWPLIITAVILWFSSVITSIPTSSMIVQNKNVKNYYYKNGLPGLNFSDVFNGSYFGFADKSLCSVTEWSDSSPNGVISNGVIMDPSNDPGVGSEASALLSHLAISTLLNGKIGTIQSPCGPSCSYFFEFDGPYLSCKDNGSVMLQSINVDPRNIMSFNSSWANSDTIPLEADGPGGGANTLSNASFEISLYQFNGINQSTEYNKSSNIYSVNFNFNLSMIKTSLSCYPQRARYRINFSWQDNVFAFTPEIISTNNLRLWSNGLAMPNGTTYTDWMASNNTFIDYYRDSNLMALIWAITTPLVGTIYNNYIINDNTAPSPAGVLYQNGSWSGAPISDKSSSMIDLTGMFTAFNDFAYPSHVVHINETVLNSYLLNFTLSLIPNLGFWTVSANLSQTESIQVFSFSKPINLILPYFITLVSCFPLLLFGLWTLYKNGVSALDRSFLQIFTTTRASPTLNRLACQSSLGGAENIRSDLKKLTVKYGIIRPEIGVEHENVLSAIPAAEEKEASLSSNSSENQTISAGFGLEGEVQSLLTLRRAYNCSDILV